jgi:ElaB/YqjD/DUF883 family membrane-anchored ribosome-binding protein
MVGSTKFGINLLVSSKKKEVPKLSRECIKLVDNKNKLLQQIEDCSTIQERAALNSLLSQTREKLRKVRKSCKARIRRAKV